MKTNKIIRLLLVILGISTLLFVLTIGDSVSFRYHGEHSPHKDMTFLQDGRVDLVFLGGSRTWRNVVAQDLQQLLENHIGRSPVIYDMGFSNIGMDARYVMARDLLEEREVSTMVVEFTSRFARGAHYPKLYKLAKFTDIVNGKFRNEKFLGSLQTKSTILAQKYSDVIAYSENAIAKNKPLLDGLGSYKLKDSYTSAVTTDVKRPNAIIPGSLKRKESLIEAFYNTEVQLNFEDDVFNPVYYYMDKIIELCEKHGTKIFFLYLPSIYEPPVDNTSISAFREKFGVELITLPMDLLENLSPVGYADTNHLNEHGAEMFQTYIANYLVDHSFLD